MQIYKHLELTSLDLTAKVKSKDLRLQTFVLKRYLNIKEKVTDFWIFFLFF